MYASTTGRVWRKTKIDFVQELQEAASHGLSFHSYYGVGPSIISIGEKDTT